MPTGKVDCHQLNYSNNSNSKSSQLCRVVSTTMFTAPGRVVDKAAVACWCGNDNWKSWVRFPAWLIQVMLLMQGIVHGILWDAAKQVG